MFLTINIFLKASPPIINGSKVVQKTLKTMLEMLPLLLLDSEYWIPFKNVCILNNLMDQSIIKRKYAF